MTLTDKDLLSIQEARSLAKKAQDAQKELAQLSQEKIDEIVYAMKEATYQERERLAKMAAHETGFGRWQDKVLKNSFGSQTVYDAIKDLKTIGMIYEDKEQATIDVAVPVGVIAALIPSTNPTSTTIFKALLAIKTGNAIVFSPHPSALNCIMETTDIIVEAAEKAGCPKGAISCLRTPTLQGTNELMKLKEVSLILATGGSAMVKAAYSSGTPAIGVGPGNAPAFIEKSANIPLAVQQIIDSKTFDNSTICASEQSVLVEECNKEAVMDEFRNKGGYFLSASEAKQLEGTIFNEKGLLKASFVGKSVKYIANEAGLIIPEGTHLLITEQTRVGRDVPYSLEKLCPILAFYTVKNWESALELCLDILSTQGAGHTLVIHTENEQIVKEFALKIPVYRLLVNTSAAVGAIGATTNLFPSLTLGSGAVGGSSTSDNINPYHLMNIRKVAYGTKAFHELKQTEKENKSISEEKRVIEDDLINTVVQRVLAQLQG